MSEYLLRRTPLTRKTPIARGKQLARRRMKRSPPKPGFDEQAKAAVRRRSGNLCEISSVCCTRTAAHFHHRKLRRFGDHSEINCLHVCSECHLHIHAHPTMSYLMGWMVRGEHDPAEIPVKFGQQR